MDIQTVFLIALMAAVTSANGNTKAIWQFREMIKCVLPASSPILEFNDYGCYCGFGGSGTPVDQLDRCCQTHDSCYKQAKSHSACIPVIDNPYTNTYSFTCSGGKLTCNSGKVCDQFICECDRIASVCFAGAPYNKEYKNLDKNKYCK
ncbi:phospholipase A2 isoform X2 [Protopterus annectens]|uniref:phospholipase A2 isoform X2 n=1 Tax=Protopterus annectens TaxID=7888 RepID=UPI001CF97643|nr:phospholipase A2 isoform X2 [Protopterus annectens]